MQSTHEQHGAEFIELHGQRVPLHFGDTKAEYEALRSSSALLDLSLRSLWKVTGKDRAIFLQNMLTNDIVRLKPGEGCHAFKLNVRGKIEAAMQVFCDEDILWCDLEPGPAESTLAALNKRIIFEDVHLEDVSEAWALFSLQGPQAGKVAEALGITAALEELQSTTVSRDDFALHVVRRDHTGQGGFDFWVRKSEAARVWQRLLESGRQTQPDFAPAGFAALDVCRIEAGIPWHGSEITEERFPQELGLDASWIDYQKGCYLGQETISRIHHMGHVNRTLCGLHFEPGTQLERGAELYESDKKVGEVTSLATSPRLSHDIGLGFVRSSAARDGTRLLGRSAGIEATVIVKALPART